MDSKRSPRGGFILVRMACDKRKVVSKRHRLAITLVEVLVIILIIGVLVALLLPSIGGSREGARRSQCISNLKQLGIAVQNYHDTHKSLPMASTSPLVPTDGIQQYGAVGTASPSAESPTNWTAGQQGDGYSWIAQCLPFLEISGIFEKMASTQDMPVVRTGKLSDAAFAPSSNQDLQVTATTESPFFWSAKIPFFVCPSFPGEEDVAPFGIIPGTAGLKVATGNYVALAATHFRSSPINHLESGLPTAAGANAGGKDCASGAFCGNGGLPFPGIVGGWVQKTGLSYQSFSVGTSHVAIITESREETLTSWYSGLASYVVAAMPPPNGAEPGGLEFAPGQFVWSCNGVANCDTALNKGDVRGDTTKFYQPASPHGGGARNWGPSSWHPGVVIHGYADAHVESISDDVDKDVYLHLVLREGREVFIPEPEN